MDIEKIKFKQQVLNSGLVDVYKNFKLFKYSEYCAYNYGTFLNKNLIEYEDKAYLFAINYSKEWREAERIFNATRSRVTRLRKRISNMLNENCLFLTLTFTDNVLNSTTCETRRTYVTRFLKSFSVPFVANIDFGAKNGREHYHAILQIDKINYSLWPYGALNGKKIINNDSLRLSKYISKLTNHAIKFTTKGSRLIYSR